jgi:tetratricopeptide (TPR) repeat protein
MKHIRPPIFFRTCLILLLLGSVSFIPIEQKINPHFKTNFKIKINLINSAFQKALHPAYLAYSLSEKSTWSRPYSTSPFLRVNQLLTSNVMPQVETAWNLANLHFINGGKKIYRTRLSGWRLRIKGLQLLNTENYQQAISILKKALKIHQKIGDQKTAGLIFNNLAYAYFQQGNLKKALEQEQAAWQTDTNSNKALFAYNLGWISLNLERFEQAINYLEKAVHLSRQNQNHMLHASALINQSIPSLYMGNISQARSLLDKGRQLAVKNGSLRLSIIASYNLAILAIMENNALLAQQHFKTALLLLENHGEKVFLQSERDLLKQQTINLLVKLQTNNPRKLFPTDYRIDTLIEEHQKKTLAIHSHAAHMLVRFDGGILKTKVLFNPSENPSPGRVVLGSVLTFPDSSSTLPVHFMPSSKAKIKFLKFEINLPKGVSFINLEKAPSLEIIATELTAKIHKENKTTEGSFIEIKLLATKEQILPKGLLFYLNISFDKTVHPGSLTLKNRAQAQDLSTPEKTLQTLIFEDTQITVLDNESVPAMVCFYYLH